MARGYLKGRGVGGGGGEGKGTQLAHQNQSSFSTKPPRQGLGATQSRVFWCMSQARWTIRYAPGQFVYFTMAWSDNGAPAIDTASAHRETPPTTRRKQGIGYCLWRVTQ